MKLIVGRVRIGGVAVRSEFGFTPSALVVIREADVISGDRRPLARMLAQAFKDDPILLPYIQSGIFEFDPIDITKEGVH